MTEALPVELICLISSYSMQASNVKAASWPARYTWKRELLNGKTFQTLREAQIVIESCFARVSRIVDAPVRIG
jgi:hypothetical protein